MEIRQHLYNNYTDNYDYFRFGTKKKAKPNLKLASKIIVKKMLNRLLIHHNAKRLISEYQEGLKSFYENLENRESKELLTKLLAYRFLGHKRVKLPTNTPSYWQDLKKLHADLGKLDREKVNNKDELYLFDLTNYGYPLRLYQDPYEIYLKFILGHYQYSQNGHSIRIGVSPGDYVIDAGACYGETALLFSHLTGSNGHVYCFEFLPAHINIFKRNISLNPASSNLITLFQEALWNESGLTLGYYEKGTGSNVIPDQSTSSGNNSVLTVKIDELVGKGIIPRVDFIKMDIEGAELRALKGAEQTLRAHKPKLAISLYHNLSDFVTIPEYIKSLNLGYKLYLGHYTIHKEETVLFASAF